jgi:hypothetical protein
MSRVRRLLILGLATVALVVALGGTELQARSERICAVHKGHQIEISIEAWSAHAAHGDTRC